MAVARIPSSFTSSEPAVDTGIHADRWSREQAIQYILDHSSAGREEAAIAIDRYIATR
jgi:uncharacterized protein (DUF885 family)